MELKLEGSALQQILEGAVIQALGESGRDALVKHVVEYLTTPKGGYGAKNSPLLDALNMAASQAATKYFRDKVENDPTFAAALEQLYADGVKKFLDSDTREKTIDRIADRLSSAFGDRY